MLLHRLGDECLRRISIQETDLFVLAHVEQERVLLPHLFQPAADGKDKVEAGMMLHQAAQQIEHTGL